MSKLTQETLDLIKSAQSISGTDFIQKNFSQPGSATTGIQGYSLEAGAKTLYPIITPLRNRIARVSGGTTVQANWKAITGINTTNQRAGVAEGQRGGSVQHSSAEYFANFRGIGLEKSVSFEADYAARGFEDLKAMAVLQTLQSLMVQEEMILLGGNTSVSLGTTPTPTLVASSGGTLGAGNLSVICVALGLQAYWDVAGANNGQVGQSLTISSAVVPTTITRTNADGTTTAFGGGSARKSAAATVAVSASGKVTAKLPSASRGAVAYAWYWGAAGSETLGAVTTVTEVVITANAAGLQTAASLPAADNSTSNIEFDGLLTQISKPGMGGYWKDLSGAALTSNGAGGILEFDSILHDFFTMHRLSPQEIHMSAIDLTTATNLIMSSGGTPLMRLNVDINSTKQITAGVVIGSYLNKITGDEIKIVVHPNMPPGSILFYSDRIPAYLDGVGSLLRVLCRQDYYQIDWPLRSRKHEYGVYCDEVLQNYFIPAFGLLTNVKSG